jgi:hypothetical protein
MSQVNPSADPIVLPQVRGRILIGVMLALAVAAGAISGWLWSIDPRRSVFSYLTAWLFVTSISVGALAWVMLHHLTGAVWSVAGRRLLENLTRPLLWIAIGFLPIASNLKELYPWADPSRLASDPELARKAVWLSPLLFLVRSGIYLALWALVAGILWRQSDLQDPTGDLAASRRMRATSAWGLVVLGLTTSYAAFDWMMSLDPHWVSTIFGVYFWAGSLLGALAAIVLVVLCFRRLGLLRHEITVEHLHDLGKLLFSFVVFWAYIAFSQYFLIWYANLPAETEWYIRRRTGDWNILSWGLVFGHFLVPSAILLFRAVRRDPFWLGFSAAWILVFHYLDLYWLIMPVLNDATVAPSWIDLSILLTLVFLFSALVTYACQERTLPILSGLNRSLSKWALQLQLPILLFLPRPDPEMRNGRRRGPQPGRKRYSTGS